MEIYLTRLTRRGGYDLLHTPFIGQTTNTLTEVQNNTALAQALDHSRSGARIIYHLLYRRGKFIEQAERLLYPENQQWRGGHLVTNNLNTNDYQTNSGHQHIHDNPRDSNVFTKFYVGYTTNFYTRAKSHAAKKGYKRMYVIYRNKLEPNSHQAYCTNYSGVNFEASMQNFLKNNSHVPMMEGNYPDLKYDNRQTETYCDYEYVYLCFG